MKSRKTGEKDIDTGNEQQRNAACRRHHRFYVITFYIISYKY